MRRGFLTWIPLVLGLLWLCTAEILEAMGIYAYYLRAPWIQALVCAVVVLPVFLGLWRHRPWIAVVPALLGLGWAGWSVVRMVADPGGWVRGSITFVPAMLLLVLADLILHLFAWRARRRS
jgi:hypothetical protein